MCSFYVRAQPLTGIVTNGETLLPLAHVSVLDITTGQTAATGLQGSFTIDAKPGDKLSFSFSGFHTIDRIAEYTDSMHVALLPLSVNLPAYTLHEFSKYEQDSMELTTLYSKELNKKPVKTKVEYNGCINISGLIGGPVQRMSKSYKQNKRFKAAFKKDMEQKFVDTRYKPTLVATLTGLSGDSLIVFMNTHPMDYVFARAATELEIKAWIRSSYKEFIGRKT
jgi:hypothetical protein